MKFLLDTNVLLVYVRDDNTRQFIEEKYAPFSDENESVISIVSVAEIMVLASVNGWGDRKLRLLQRLIDKLMIVDLNYRDIIDNYIEIEQYNRNVHPVKTREGSHINMGKNDVWIAATAMATDSRLITSDTDFDHLDGVFLDLILVKQLP